MPGTREHVDPVEGQRDTTRWKRVSKLEGLAISVCYFRLSGHHSDSPGSLKNHFALTKQQGNRTVVPHIQISMAKTKSKKPKVSGSAGANTATVDALKTVLADSYAIMAQSHLCHWNVEGPSFFALHTAFEQQYTELFTAIDEIAERIRALGAYSPGGLSSLAKLAEIKEQKEQASAVEMVKGLAVAHRKLIKDAANARDIAGDTGDTETEDLMIARIQLHQKTLWMLESFLK